MHGTVWRYDFASRCDHLQWHASCGQTNTSLRSQHNSIVAAKMSPIHPSCASLRNDINNYSPESHKRYAATHCPIDLCTFDCCTAIQCSRLQGHSSDSRMCSSTSHTEVLKLFWACRRRRCRCRSKRGVRSNYKSKWFPMKFDSKPVTQSGLSRFRCWVFSFTSLSLSLSSA